MATFTWNIVKMDSVAQTDQKYDLVVTAYWTCTGTQDVDGFTYTSVYSDSLPIPYIQADPWTDYANLTPAIVLEWCWEHGVDKAQIEGVVQGMIDSTPKPPVVTKPLPW
jgi:hypothetical protein